MLIRPYPDLKSWRAAHGLSQRQAAKLLDISQSLYCRVEQRAMGLGGKTALRVMARTGVPVEVLINVA